MTRKPRSQSLAGDEHQEQPVELHRGRPVRRHFLQITGSIELTADEAAAYLERDDDVVDLVLPGRVVKELWHRVGVKVTDANADGLAYDHQLTFHGKVGGDDGQLALDLAAPTDPDDDEPGA